MTSKKTCIFLLSIFLVSQAWADQIHVAARDGHIQRVISLMNKDPKLAYTWCDMGKTPLHWATGWGQHAVMKVLLDRYKVDVNVRNKQGGTPLHVAASQARPEGARILLRRGAKVDAIRRQGGATPLHVAALKSGRAGHYEVAKILLAAKANPHARMDNGLTPMALAQNVGNVKTAKLIADYIKNTASDLEKPWAGSGPKKTQSGWRRRPRTMNTSPLEQRRQMMLERFDKDGDGFLSMQERQQMRQMFLQGW